MSNPYPEYKRNTITVPAPVQQEPVAVHQFRNRYATDWYDGVPDYQDGHGPYEVRTLYTFPQPTPVQGWKLVPVEPTQKMLDAPPNAYPADALVTWKAMLAAAPQPAVQQCMDHGECFGGKCIYPAPQPAQRKPLTEDEIKKVLTEAIRAGNVAWIGYEQDEDGKYTIPVLPANIYQIARAIEAAHGIKEQP